MLNILLLDNNVKIGAETRKLLSASEFSAHTELQSAGSLEVLAALEQERPDAIMFCANDAGEALAQDAELLRMIRASGFVFQILLIVRHRNRDVSRIALEFDVEWVVALEDESELLMKALQRMDQKQKLIRESRSAKMRQLLVDYLNDEQRLSATERAQLFKDYRHETAFQIAVVRVLPPYRKQRLPDGESLMNLKGYAMLEERLGSLKKFMLARNGMDAIVCLMGTPEELAEGREQLRWYLREMQEFNQTVSRCAAWAFLGSIVQKIDQIGESYREANDLIFERLLDGSVALLEQGGRDEKKERFAVFDIRKTLMNSMETFEEQAIYKAMAQLKSNLLSTTDLGGHQLFLVYKTLVSALFREMERREAELNGMRMGFQAALQEYSYFWDINDMFVCLEQMYLEGLDALRRQEEESVAVPILLAKRYIRSYFNMPLTLGEVSEYVGMNENYFSDYFRKCTKMTFKQYQTDLRIRYSKQMLLDKQYTMEDIAEAVGYNDVKYFSRVFKQVSGISPGEYRKKYHVLKD